MTRYNLAYTMAHILDIPGYKAAPLVDAFLKALTKNLQDGMTVELRGFGTFTPIIKKARGGTRNPRTGEPCPLPARPGIKFRPCKKLLGQK
jgi:integration host factor subunit beta